MRNNRICPISGGISKRGRRGKETVFISGKHEEMKGFVFIVVKARLGMQMFLVAPLLHFVNFFSGYFFSRSPPSPPRFPSGRPQPWKVQVSPVQIRLWPKCTTYVSLSTNQTRRVTSFTVCWGSEILRPEQWVRLPFQSWSPQ